MVLYQASPLPTPFILEEQNVNGFTLKNGPSSSFKYNAIIMTSKKY